jgi:hypothetical protein
MESKTVGKQKVKFCGEVREPQNEVRTTPFREVVDERSNEKQNVGGSEAHLDNRCVEEALTITLVFL